MSDPSTSSCWSSFRSCSSSCGAYSWPTSPGCSADPAIVLRSKRQLLGGPPRHWSDWPDSSKSRAHAQPIGDLPLRAGPHRRNRVLWAFLVAVPSVFIGMAISVALDVPGPIALVDRGRHFTALLSARRIHAATMVPVTSAFLAGLTGLFVATLPPAVTGGWFWPVFDPVSRPALPDGVRTCRLAALPE